MFFLGGVLALSIFTILRWRALKSAGQTPVWETWEHEPEGVRPNPVMPVNGREAGMKDALR